MNAAQMGMATTEHNIANANTPGFSRQQVVLGASQAFSYGSGFLGQGVNVVNVRRIYDQFVSSQVLQQQNQANYLSSYHAAMSQIDNLLADAKTGISVAMQDMFGSINAVASAPASTAARQTLLSNAQSVVNRFQAIDQQLADMANAANGHIASSIKAINSYAQQIAALNTSIKAATASAQGQPPNDLLDQRDQLISQLNQEISVSVIPQGDGSLSVFIGNGQPLVLGDQAMMLQGNPAPTDPAKIAITFTSGTVAMPLPQGSLQGGNLGAYLDFRNQDLDAARNALGRVALGLASSLNQQNQMGLDLNGVLGGSLFNVATPVIIAAAGNAGSAAIAATVSDVTALTTSDYQLKYDGSNYMLTRLTDNTVTNLGATLPQSVDGFTINLTSGTPAAGDSFLIKPTVNGARDIALLTRDTNKIAAAAPMRATASLSNLGSATISGGTVNTPPPVNANLQSAVSLTFTSPTTFTVSGAVPAVAGAVTYTPGQNISYNGWTVQIAGTPAAGDVFNIAANTNAAGDNRNALLMAALQSQNLMANGTASLSGIYNQMVGEVGVRTHELDVTSQAQNNMAAQAVAAQQSVSGVNLDEEAAKLMQYQRAYQASAKAMQVANSMFDALLAIHP